MNNPIRVGIIGTGFGGKVHAPLMTEHPNFEVIAISSVHRGNSEDIRAKTGIENVYTDWREMIQQQKLDLVSVVSMPSLHHEMTLECFKKEVHVLCEKPMAINQKESLEMIAARDEIGHMGFLNFEWRYLPARLYVKKLLDQDKIGKVMHIRYFISTPGYESSVSGNRGWLGKKEVAGGMLGALGSHLIDSLNWWLNDTMISVYGQLNTHVPISNTGEKRTADDSFQIMGTFTKGTVLTLDFISTARQGFGSRVEIFGTKGTIEVINDKEVKVGYSDTNGLEKVNLVEPYLGEHYPAPIPRYYPAFYPYLNDLYESIINKKYTSDIATFEDGLSVQKVIDAIHKSVETGKRVGL